MSIDRAGRLNLQMPQRFRAPSGSTIPATCSTSPASIRTTRAGRGGLAAVLVKLDYDFQWLTCDASASDTGRQSWMGTANYARTSRTRAAMLTASPLSARSWTWTRSPNTLSRISPRWSLTSSASRPDRRQCPCAIVPGASTTQSSPGASGLRLGDVHGSGHGRPGAPSTRSWRAFSLISSATSRPGCRPTCPSSSATTTSSGPRTGLPSQLVPQERDCALRAPLGAHPQARHESHLLQRPATSPSWSTIWPRSAPTASSSSR